MIAGISSAANVLGALKLAETLTAPAVIVTVLCDMGMRYVSEQFWFGAEGTGAGS